MERDEQQLIPAEERPPPLPQPEYVANFSVRDFSETHFAVRKKRQADRGPIARTPEELRRKLATRD